MAEQNIRAEAKAHGIGPERIIFADIVPREEHLKRTYLADLCLDTPMFNGQHTSFDSLWGGGGGGTPVLTLAVEKMVSRVGSSIVNAAGTPEMITKNLEEYEELAVKLAKNYLSPGAGAVSQLDKIRAVGENRFSNALFDTKKWQRASKSFKVWKC